MQNVKKGFFIFWQIPITLGTIENLNLFGIFCVSISLQNAEALAETGGFPSNFRFYTRMFAQWRSRPLFQCRYKITETHAQALFLFPLVSRAHRLDSFCHWFSIKFLKLYLVSCQFICRVFKLILVKLLIVCVFTIISQGAPLGLAVEMN